MALPAALMVDQSMRSVPPDGSRWGEFVGFQNYHRVLTSDVVWHSVFVTVVFTGGFVLVSTGIGLGMALLLNQAFFGRSLLRAVLVIPWACPWLIAGIVWKWFVDGDVGGLNSVLYRLGVVDDYVNFLASPTWALIVVVLAAAWRQASLVALLLLAGLQTMPPELQQAAAIDGAGVMQRFWHMTLPWLRPVMAIVTVLNLVYGLMQFDLVYTMTQGGPADATTLTSILIYKQMFTYTNLGAGSAIATVLAAMAATAGYVAVKVIYRRVEL